MAFTQSDIELLEESIRTSIRNGTWQARSFTFSDQAVQLVTLEEAQKFLAWMRQQVAVAGGRSRTRYASTCKGV